MLDVNMQYNFLKINFGYDYWKIIHLKEMLDQGLISEEEFNQIKSDLLSKL